MKKPDINYDPCPESLMLGEKYPRYVICEVLRQIYHLSSDEGIRLRARIAMTMAKRMNSKLKEYKVIFDNTEWTKSTDAATREIDDITTGKL